VLRQLDCAPLAEGDDAVQRRIAVIPTSIGAHSRLPDELPDEPEKAELGGPVQDGLATLAIGRALAALGMSRSQVERCSTLTAQISGVMRHWPPGSVELGSVRESYTLVGFALPDWADSWGHHASRVLAVW